MSKPFSKTSKAGTGWAMIYVFLLMELANYADFPLTESEAFGIVQMISVTAGLVLAVWGQIMREDLEWGLWRKDPR